MITFRQMTDTEYNTYKEQSINEYATDLTRSGKAFKQEALDAAKKEFAAILPNERLTPHNHMYVIVNENGKDIGLIWYKGDENKEHKAFIFDFYINEEERNKGYGTQALYKAEEDAKDRGYKQMGLNVFHFNTGARALYERCGYKPFKVFDGNTHMEKDLL